MKNISKRVIVLLVFLLGFIPCSVFSIVTIDSQPNQSLTFEEAKECFATSAAIEIVEAQIEEFEKPKTIYYELIENLTEYEKTLIYQITFLESGNQSMEGQMAVVEVILNRVNSTRFPNTVEKVLSQKSQFSTWKNRNSAKYSDTQKEALENLKYETVLPNSNYAFFARGKQSYAKNHVQIGAHWFGEIR